MVERPASVLKELLENSIDAGATRIEVEVRGAGVDEILVVDDGAGIEAAELPLAFTRHATSKLRSADDLAAIASLGFRGEALASIAAVARVRCTSTRRGEGTGAEIAVEYGRAGGVHAAAAVPGTRLEVRGLFENTPARRAFLKRPATEAAQLVRVATAMGLARPGVSLRVTLDGRRVLDLRGDGLPAAFARLYPDIAVGELLRVTGGDDDDGVSGVLADPTRMRRTRDHLYIVVNDRPVQSRALAFAVEQAFHGLATPGLFPVGAIQLRLAARDVDVNVHPTKREVRFRYERQVFSLVQRACLEALRRSPAFSGVALFASGADATEDAPVLVREPAGPAYWSDSDRRPGRPLDPDRVSSPLLDQAVVRRGPFRLVGQVAGNYILAESPPGC